MTRKRLVHAIATCETCDWMEEVCNRAEKKASEHAKKNPGHKVSVDLGYVKWAG